MLTTKAAFGAISPFWTDTFEDTEVLESVYQVLASCISEAYGSLLELPANLRIADTPLTSPVSQYPLILNPDSTLQVDLGDSGGVLTVYGLSEDQGLYLSTASRIYAQPQSTGDSYLEAGLHYDLFPRGHSRLDTLSSRTGRARFFSRYPKYLITYSTSIESLDNIYYLESDTQIARYYAATAVELPLSLQTTEEDIALEVSGITSNCRLDSVAKTSSGLWEVVLPLEEYIDPGEIKFVYISRGADRVKLFFRNPAVSSRLPFIAFASRGTIDRGDLLTRYGHILIDSPGDISSVTWSPSTRVLLNSILAIRDAKLNGLSTATSYKVISALCGIDLLRAATNLDPVSTVDTAKLEIGAGLTKYRLVPEYPLNYALIQALQYLPGANASSIDISDCLLVPIAPLEAIRLTSKLGTPLCYSHESTISLEVPSVVGLTAQVLAITSRGIVVTAVSGGIPTERFLAYIAGTLVECSGGSEEISPATAPEGTPLQVPVEILDLSSGPDWWKQEGVFVPEYLWSNGARENEVTAATWAFNIGRVGEHRIGDYGIFIGDTRIHSAAWNLMRDVYSINTCFIRCSSFSPPVVETASNYLKKLAPLGSAIFVTKESGLRDLMSTPQEVLAVAQLTDVGVDALSDSAKVNTPQGMPSADYRILMAKPDKGISGEVQGVIINSVEYEATGYVWIDPEAGTRYVIAQVELNSGLAPITDTSGGVVLAGDATSYVINDLRWLNTIGGGTSGEVIGGDYPLIPPPAIVSFIDPDTITEFLEVEAQ